MTPNSHWIPFEAARQDRWLYWAVRQWDLARPPGEHLNIPFLIFVDSPRSFQPADPFRQGPLPEYLLAVEAPSSWEKPSHQHTDGYYWIHADGKKSLASISFNYWGEGKHAADPCFGREPVYPDFLKGAEICPVKCPDVPWHLDKPEVPWHLAKPENHQAQVRQDSLGMLMSDSLLRFAKVYSQGTGKNTTVSTIYQARIDQCHIMSDTLKRLYGDAPIDLDLLLSQAPRIPDGTDTTFSTLGDVSSYPEIFWQMSCELPHIKPSETGVETPVQLSYRAVRLGHLLNDTLAKS